MDARPNLWRGRRVLVTGCTGFLGTAATRELLDRGAVVVGLVRDRAGGIGFAGERDAKRFHILHGRVEDAARLRTAMAVHEISAVFHFAGSDAFGNDRGTVAVLQAAANHHSLMPVVTARPSGQLRLALEEESPPLSISVARFGELFGMGDRKVFRVVPRTAIGLLTGDTAPLSDGPVRDFVFVRDAARACLALAEAVGAEAQPLDFTFRSGLELSEREMASMVSAAFAGKGVEAAIETVTNPLGWQPITSLSSALGETIAWYREFLRTRFFGIRSNRTARKVA